MPVFVSYSKQPIQNGSGKPVEAWTIRHLNAYCETLDLTGEMGLFPVGNSEKLQAQTTRCRRLGCWDSYAAEYQDGPVVPDVVVPRLSKNPWRGKRLVEKLREAAAKRPFSEPATGHLIYVITPPGDARVTRRLTGFKPPRPECYIGETSLVWPKRVDQHVTKAISGIGESEFLVEVLRQGGTPFSAIIEYGHQHPSLAQDAEEYYWRLARELGWAATGALVRAPRWKGPPH